MADRLAGGELEDIIRTMRSEGKSFDTISRSLYAAYGIVVTAQTVTTWWGKLNQPADGAA